MSLLCVILDSYFDSSLVGADANPSPRLERVTDVLMDRAKPTYAIFDLGWNDKTAVIVCQRHLSSLRVIDYREDSHKTLDYYSGWLRDRDYAVSELFLPHDGAHDHLTGQSAQRTLEDL